MTDSGSGDAPSPFRRPGFILAAVFLAVIVVLGVVVVLTRSGSDTPSAALPPSSSTTSNPGMGGCRPTDTDQQIPTTAPVGVTWELFQAIALPVSSAAGPLVRQGDMRSCYARTPTGALIAALQIEARLTYSSSWQLIADRQVVDGPGKAAFLEDRKAKGARPPLPPGGVAQYAGFRFITYDQNTAVIDFANRLTPTAYATGTSTVKWQDGDWRLEAQPDGSLYTEGAQISSLEGYVAWGGA